MQARFLRRNKENFRKYYEYSFKTQYSTYYFFNVCIKINDQYYGLDKSNTVQIIPKDAIKIIKEFEIYDLVKTSRLNKHPDFSRAKIDNTWMLQNTSSWLVNPHKQYMLDLFMKVFPEEFIWKFKFL